MPTIIQLVYVSSATRPFTQSELVTLLIKARIKNSQHGITGMLLYKDGNFMQVLEGEESAVRDLFEIIEADPRHRGTEVSAQPEVFP